MKKETLETFQAVLEELSRDEIEEWRLWSMSSGALLQWNWKRESCLSYDTGPGRQINDRLHALLQTGSGYPKWPMVTDPELITALKGAEQLLKP